MIQLLKNLTSLNGVSGSERSVANFISSQIRENVSEISSDSMGNLICTKKGVGKRILLAAHMDEVGVIVTHVENNGYLRFSAIGGINIFYSLYQKVLFDNGTIGVIGYEEEIEEIKDIKIKNLFIDIGAKNKEDASEKVKVGDSAAFIGSFVQEEGRIVSKALDDRSGCAVLIELSNRLKDSDSEIVYTFTTQEELGLRGAKTAAYAVNPDMAFVVDVTGTGDTPKTKPSPIKCGNGPIIKIMDRAYIINSRSKDLLVETAEQNHIPYQLKVASTGGTDAGEISVLREGIPTASIAIPCRYLHSPVETVYKEDIENMVKLLENTIKKL